MKQPARFVLVGAALCVSACLPNDIPVKGRLLHAGINIENPLFLGKGDDQPPQVLFDVRLSRAIESLGGRLDLHSTGWLTADDKVVVPNRSDRVEWQPAGVDSAGASYYMVNERLATDGTGLPVGDLMRVVLGTGTVLETIPDVLNYSLPGGGSRFYYRKYVAGAVAPELHLRDLTGKDHNLGPLSGQAQLIGNDRLYFIGGDDRTLYFSPSFDATPTPVRTHVSRFMLSGDQSFAILAVSDDSSGVAKVQSLKLDLKTKAETPLSVENPCCWIELRGTTFVFGESAHPGVAAKLHYDDVATGMDKVVDMPAAMADVSSIMRQPPDFADRLFLDREGQVAVMLPNGTVQMTQLRPSVPEFTSDGHYFVYIDKEPPPPPPAVTTVETGKLMIQDGSDWTAPPRQISPFGASVPITQKGYRLRDDPSYPLVFWARYGLGGSDLYIGSLQTLALLKVADDIGQISISDREVVGVVRMSQDLTGDLVDRDFTTGQERVIEHGVAELQLFYNPTVGDIVGFVVRERNPDSPRNGLWAGSLDQPDAGAADGAVDAGVDAGVDAPAAPAAAAPTEREIEAVPPGSLSTPLLGPTR